MSKSILSMTLVFQIGIALYLAGHLGESQASHFEKPLDMSKLCSATICQEPSQKFNPRGDSMIVSTHTDY